MKKNTVIQVIEKGDLTLVNGSKKELTKQAKDYVKQLLDDGFVEVNNVIADSARLSHFFATILKEVREHYDHNIETAKGVQMKHRNGGSKLDYSDDWKVAILEKQLKDRKELVKTAFNSDVPIYDEEGIEVTKVGSTPIKDSLTITF